MERFVGALEIRVNEANSAVYQGYILGVGEAGSLPFTASNGNVAACGACG